jgi:hypothetical protein
VPDFDAAVAWHTEKLEFRLTRSFPHVCEVSSRLST